MPVPVTIVQWVNRFLFIQNCVWDEEDENLQGVSVRFSFRFFFFVFVSSGRYTFRGYIKRLLEHHHNIAILFLLFFFWYVDMGWRCCFLLLLLISHYQGLRCYFGKFIISNTTTPGNYIQLYRRRSSVYTTNEKVI